MNPTTAICRSLVGKRKLEELDERVENLEREIKKLKAEV